MECIIVIPWSQNAPAIVYIYYYEIGTNINYIKLLLILR